MSTETAINPAIFDWNGPMGLPEFSKIARTDFAAAFELALKRDRADIDAIADDEAEPDFGNVVERLELSGRDYGRVSALFWNLVGADSDDVLRELQKKIAPVLSRHGSETAMNPRLFARIDALSKKRHALGLTAEQDRVLERTWKGFVRSGAALEGGAQKRFADINARLAELGAAFSQNLLADESEWIMFVEDAGLDGLPGFLCSAMKSAASERGHEGKHAVTLSRSVMTPFLTFCRDRALREEAFTAWTNRGQNGGKTDNRDIVRETVALRAEKAKLLGYRSFADFKLDDTMAKTPEAVNGLLTRVWEKALDRASEEEDEIAGLVAAEGGNHPVAPWDWAHYAEKVRARKFAYDESELKPYLPLEAIIEAAFETANRLFAITVEERKDIGAYHPDVRVFEVLNPDGSHRAVFLGDYFARPSKRSGAWMSGFQGQHKLEIDGKSGQSPIIVNVMNFAKAPAGEQTLLSFDDARTLFHEFGHALHGIMSDVTYPSVAGTSVSRDFVELPSQLYEHWLTVPEVLSKHARHVDTGEPMPQELLEKVLAAQKFNAGFDAVEFTASALVDMAFHSARDEAIEDPLAFEERELEKLKMPAAITMRHRTPHFAHVFSGDGYSAGYYSYMWSEVLDADAFQAFEETGDVFDSETANKLNRHIYSAGGAVDPEATYTAFRGRLPEPDAMLEKRGLIDPV